MITSHLARAVGRLDDQSYYSIFQRAVFRNRVMSLKAVCTSRRASLLSVQRPSTIPGLLCTVGERGLCDAVEIGFYPVVEILIDHGASVDACSFEGAGALHISASLHRVEVAQLLLANGADVNLNRRGGSPLHYAITSSPAQPEKKERLAMVRLLLKYGADVSVRDQDNGTVLHSAILHGLTAEIPFLIDSGAPIEAKQNNNMTPLMIACQKSRASTQLLLAGGANPNSALPSGHDCLCLAIDCGSENDDDRVRTIKLLIDYGANVDGNGPNFAPLCQSLTTDSILQYTTVEALLNAGADIEKADLTGYTPLETWIERSQWHYRNVFDLLLKRNVDVDKLNYQRRSPISQVCAAPGDRSFAQRWYIVQELIGSGADVNQADANGDTPAMIVCTNRELSRPQKYRLLRLLLEHGASIGSENRQRETLLIKVMRHFEYGTKGRRLVLDLVLKGRPDID